MSHVVGQRRGLGDVGVRAEGARQVARDLGHLEAVREPVADEVVGLRPDDLGLGREPARRRRVDHPCPVALERQPHGRVDALGRLGDEALPGAVVVQVLDAHRPVSLVPTRLDATPPGSVHGDVHVVVVVGGRRPTVRQPAPALAAALHRPHLLGEDDVLDAQR